MECSRWGDEPFQTAAAPCLDRSVSDRQFAERSLVFAGGMRIRERTVPLHVSRG